MSSAYLKAQNIVKRARKESKLAFEVEIQRQLAAEIKLGIASERAEVLSLIAEEIMRATGDARGALIGIAAEIRKRV